MPKQVLIPFRHANKVKAYEAAARAGGMDPIAVFVGDPMPFANASGLLLMGGADVNPKRYGQVAQPETDPPDDERDQVELDLIHAALERDLPILAICRGLQILNVYHGGNAEGAFGSDQARPGEGRSFGSSARSAIFTGQPVGTDCGRGRLAGQFAASSGSRASGRRSPHSGRDSEDGIVEGLEQRDKRFVVAVQVVSGGSNCKVPRATPVISEFRGPAL